MAPLLAWLGLAAMAATGGNGETIVLKRTPTACLCPPAGDCLYCAETTVTVPAKGAGHIRVVWRNDKAIEERDFVLTEEEADVFRGRLASYRPARGGRSLDGTACKQLWSDGTYYDIVWQTSGARRLLHLYSGCDPERNYAMAEEVERAWGGLPLNRRGR